MIFVGVLESRFYLFAPYFVPGKGGKLDIRVFVDGELFVWCSNFYISGVNSTKEYWLLKKALPTPET